MQKLIISASRDSNAARAVPPEVIFDRHHSRLLTRLLQKQILVASHSAPPLATTANSADQQNTLRQFDIKTKRFSFLIRVRKLSMQNYIHKPKGNCNCCSFSETRQLKMRILIFTHLTSQDRSI